MAITTIVQQLFTDETLPLTEREELEKLEQYALHGMKSFHPTTSIVIQWRSIDSNIRRHFDTYKAIIAELLGQEAAEKIEKKREYYENVRPIVFQLKLKKK